MNKKRLSAILLAVFLLTGCAAKGMNTNVQETPGASETPDAAESPSVSESPDGRLFVFTRENFPVMDGSTSTIPLGQAVASVLLGEPREDVADLAVFNKTTQSFRNLMNGVSDILIVGEPNPSVFTEMDEAGFEYELSPIAMDGLVFVVNADNPVSGLSTEQIQKIYTGEITNWSQVGGEDIEIKAFQRNADAGSQSLMEKLVMGEIAMMEPPVEYVVGDMEGLLTGVKSFDGTAQAIGYTVYYYADDMQMADGLKILAVDGVAPNDKTIANGNYPFLNPYYAVISAGEPEDSPARILYNWLLGEEGQTLIRHEGYVPVNG